MEWKAFHFLLQGFALHFRNNAIQSEIKSVGMVAITVKIRRTSVHRKILLLIATASFLVICISVELLYNTLQILRQGPTTPPINIVIHPSSCKEGVTSNISTTSLLKPTIERRRGDYPHYHHISQLVEGEGLSATNTENAICKFRTVKYWHHFPHTYVPCMGRRYTYQSFNIEWFISPCL